MPPSRLARRLSVQKTLQIPHTTGQSAFLQVTTNRCQSVKWIQYIITSQWDGRPTGHDNISLTLSAGPGHFKLKVTAPFFNDPPSPGGKDGQPFPQLWDYEVVEAFFLAKDGKYLEVELCPHGQHLLLMLDGTRNCIKDELPIDFRAEISGATWTGEAEIPASYLPPGVSAFNAYAIHGSGDQRQYEALYPAARGVHDQPDFHRLQYFQPIDFDKILPTNKDAELSEVWRNAAATK